MPLTIEHLSASETTASERFLAVPRTVYQDDVGRSPASEDLLVARVEDALDGRIEMHGVVVDDAGTPVARAAAIVEPDAEAGGAPEGWIGFFECLPERPMAGVMALRASRAWLNAHGRAEVSAPRVDSMLSGLVTSGFDVPQAVLTPYNPPSYPSIFEAAGFTPSAHLLSFRFRAAHAPRLRVPPGLGVRVRGVRLDDWEGEIARMHAFQEALFGGHVARVSRTLQGTDRLARQLAPIVDPDLCLIAEDADHATVGVLVCLPDTWQARPEGASPTRARLVSIGLQPGWRGKGAAIAMGSVLERGLLAKGYETLEVSWIFSTNSRPQTLVRALGGEPSRTAAIYRASGAPSEPMER